MKVRPSVKPICEKCKIIKRKGRVMLSAKIRSISRSRAEKQNRKRRWENTGVFLYEKDIMW